MSSAEPSEVDVLVACTTEWTVDAVRRLAIAYAREHGTVSANDLHDLLPATAGRLVSPAVHWLALASASPLCKSGGMVPSRVPGARSAVVVVYRLKRRALPKAVAA